MEASQSKSGTCNKIIYTWISSSVILENNIVAENDSHGVIGALNTLVNNNYISILSAGKFVAFNPGL